ncbi:MAG: TatD family hydrolase [Rhodocyclaceae bacterium]|nr:TatD family hydrolase [Rhodocyclaceae bacterium]
MLIDSHCHLDAAEFDADRDLVVARARAAGLGLLVVPAVAADAFERAADAGRRYPECRIAYGIHPLYAERAAPERDLAMLEQRLAAGEVVAVGEIGLDLYQGHPDFDRQQRVFVAQLELARRFDLPVLLHVRRAVDAVLKQLRRIRVPGGIAHAFNGSRQQADQMIGLGFGLGFGGAMSYPGSRRIRELAATLPLSAIVLESDAPDMPPAWARGQRNEPAQVARYAQVLAELRDVPRELVEEETSRNVGRCLPRCGLGRRAA